MKCLYSVNVRDAHPEIKSSSILSESERMYILADVLHYKKRYNKRECGCVRYYNYIDVAESKAEFIQKAVSVFLQELKSYEDEIQQITKRIRELEAMKGGDEE